MKGGAELIPKRTYRVSSRQQVLTRNERELFCASPGWVCCKEPESLMVIVPRVYVSVLGEKGV